MLGESAPSSGDVWDLPGGMLLKHKAGVVEWRDSCRGRKMLLSHAVHPLSIQGRLLVCVHHSGARGRNSDLTAGSPAEKPTETVQRGRKQRDDGEGGRGWDLGVPQSLLPAGRSRKHPDRKTSTESFRCGEAVTLLSVSKAKSSLHLSEAHFGSLIRLFQS